MHLFFWTVYDSSTNSLQANQSGFTACQIHTSEFNSHQMRDFKVFRDSAGVRRYEILRNHIKDVQGGEPRPPMDVEDGTKQITDGTFW